jgi:hypothetical protein
MHIDTSTRQPEILTLHVSPTHACLLVEPSLQPQVLFALVGLVHVTLWDGRGGKRCWRLEPGGAGLYIGPMLWLEFASQ